MSTRNNEMNVLHIDTRDNKNVFATLTKGKKKYIAKSDNLNNRPDSIVQLISQVLQKAKLEHSDIDELKVEEGPGSFTGLKVGVSVANALSFSLGKKINGNKLATIVEPKYE